MALSEATKEALYFQSLLAELIRGGGSVVIFNDNQGAIKLAENSVFHNRTKHIAVRYHFIRQAVDEGKISLRYKPTAEMVADGLTKSLGTVKHGEFVHELGLV